MAYSKKLLLYLSTYIESIAIHYNLTIPPDAREAALRALQVHPDGCPAHQSVKAAIKVIWTATVHVENKVLELSSE